MHRSPRWRGIIGALAGGLLASSAWAAPCERRTDTVSNRAGSQLLLANVECADEDQRRIEVRYRSGAKGRAHTVLRLTQSIAEAPSGGAYAVDLDGDGEMEIAVRGMCGAGPNCEGTIYKLAADRKSMFAYFVGGYADLRLQDGYLIEAGRASCCSWEFHLYSPRAKHSPIVDDDMDYLITVGLSDQDAAPPAEGGPPPEIDCTVLQRVGADWKPAAIPAPGLAALCEVYGPHYRLNPAP